MTVFSPLAAPSATRAVLEAHGLAAKKSLGQNFLVNDAVLGKILALAEAGEDDVVLEVGPGIGTLTTALLPRVRAVVAIERDRDLPAVLAETCAPWADRFALIEKDALEVHEEDLREALALLPDTAQDKGAAPSRHPESPASASPLCHPERRREALSLCHPERSGAEGDAESKDPARRQPTLPAKLVANLPYAVAATLVLDYFERFGFIESATVMAQSEVADRMAARPGSKNYGAYTVKLSLFARAAGRFQVAPASFFPPPHVESAVIRLERAPLLDAQGAPVPDEVRAATCIMADAAFASRRKTLANSCKTYFAGRGAEGARIAAALPEIFRSAGIDPVRRGETLSQGEFITLGCALLEAESSA